MLTHILHQLHYTASDFYWFSKNSEFLARVSLDPTETVEPLLHGTSSARCTDGYESPLGFFQSGKYQLCSLQY